MKRADAREMIRQIIRESVRTRMGLLTEEQVTLKGNADISVVVDDVEKSLIIRNLTSKNITRVRIADGASINTALYDSALEDSSASLAPNAVWGFSPNETVAMTKLFDGLKTASSFSVFYKVAGEEKGKNLMVDLGTRKLDFSNPSAPTPATSATPTPPSPDAAASTTNTPTTASGDSQPKKSDSPVQEPQASAGNLQDRIRQTASAVQRDFSDRTYDGGSDADSPITLEDILKDPVNTSMPDTEWVDQETGKSKYGLDNWSSKWDDKYTYFALVDVNTKKPIAFVVASDPLVDKHYSTGKFIGPESGPSNLKRAFCILYHRATGEVHESCEDGASTGPNDDVLKGSGGGGGRGRGGQRGRAGSGSGSGAGKGEGPGAIRLVSKDGIAQRGKGDAMTGILGIGMRPAEKLRGAGRKIVTKSKSNQGFSGFPDGPDGKFKRNPVFAGGGKIPPSSLGVFFEHPMAIIVDKEGMNPYINFGHNKSAENIKLIRLGWGSVGRLGLRGTLTGGVTVKPGDKGFDEAAQWVLSHQEEFDLRPDAFKIEDPISGGVTSDVKNKGTTTASSLEESLLFDRYRF